MSSANGAIILIKYQDKYLMGQETNNLSENENIMKHYTTLYKDFLSPGTIESEDDIIKAKEKFSATCKQIEEQFPDISRVTFADIRNSRTNPGFIAATPRYVLTKRRNLFGFPKGSYDPKDITLLNTIVRECYEELGIHLDLDKIKNLGKDAYRNTKQVYSYSIFTYHITKDMYEKFIEMINKKNQSRENELHNIQFIKPPTDYSDFFTNFISKDAFMKHKIKGGTRKTNKRNTSKKYSCGSV
jgi:8-oxo-dGTP pyrophosphatase MutT (NUDIX family)